MQTLVLVSVELSIFGLFFEPNAFAFLTVLVTSSTKTGQFWGQNVYRVQNFTRFLFLRNKRSIFVYAFLMYFFIEEYRKLKNIVRKVRFKVYNTLYY